MKRLRSLLCVLPLLYLTTACLNEEVGPSIFDAVASEPSLSIYLEAIQLAGYEDVLKGNNSLTLFAPNNDAFAEYFSSVGIQSVNELPLIDLRKLLLYHMIGVGANLSQFASNYFLSLSPAGPEDNLIAILLTDENGTHQLNNQATVLTKDVVASNSYYNIIDKVLDLPDTYDLIQQNENFSEILAGINSVDGLADALKDSTSYTFLAVENNALKSSLNELYSVESLGALEQNVRDDLLRAHTMKGFIQGENLRDPFIEDFETLLEGYNISASGSEPIILNGERELILVNVQTTNGIVHIVDKVLPL